MEVVKQFRVAEQPVVDKDQAVIPAAFFDAAGQPVEVGGSSGPTTVAWGSVTGKPSTFPPTVGTTATTAKAGNYVPSSAEVSSGLKAKAQIAALSPVATDGDIAAAIAGINAVIAALKA